MLLTRRLARRRLASSRSVAPCRSSTAWPCRTRCLKHSQASGGPWLDGSMRSNSRCHGGSVSNLHDASYNIKSFVYFFFAKNFSARASATPAAVAELSARARRPPRRALRCCSTNCVPRWGCRTRAM